MWHVLHIASEWAAVVAAVWAARRWQPALARLRALAQGTRRKTCRVRTFVYSDGAERSFHEHCHSADMEALTSAHAAAIADKGSRHVSTKNTTHVVVVPAPPAWSLARWRGGERA